MRSGPLLSWHAFISALAIGAGPVADAQVGGFGIGSDRASPSDVAALAIDIGKIIAAETTLTGTRNPNNPTAPPTAADIARAIEIQRQKEMLGLDGGLDVVDLAGSVRDWWATHVLQPALDVAGNPAASCSLARSMLERILQLERQAQILGLESTFGPFGDADSSLRVAFDRVRERCLEEAFDECMATGSGQALVMALTETRKQMALIDVVDDTWDDRVTYLLRRCTVYKVIYNMSLRDLDSGAAAVLDGSYILLLHLGQGGDGPTAVSNGRWATRAQDPRDVQLTSMTCSPDMTCRQASPFVGGEACGIIRKRRNVTERTFTVVPVTDASTPPPSGLEKIAGARVEFHTEVHREGENKLVLQLLPPHFATEEKFPEEIHYVPGGANSALFAEAVNAGDVPQAPGDMCPLAPVLIDNDTWVEGGYPTIFSTAHTATHSYAQETTRFDIVHRPDLFPPEEIDPNYELKRPAEPPNRTPAQPSR